MSGLTAEDLQWLEEQESGTIQEIAPPPEPTVDVQGHQGELYVPQLPEGQEDPPAPYDVHRAKEDFSWFKRKEWRKLSRHSRARLAVIEEWINAEVAKELI